MSVLFKDENFSLLDHQKYITKIYKQVLVTPTEFESFVFTKILFSIHDESMHRVKAKIKCRKRKRDMDIINHEASTVQSMFEDLLKKLPTEIIYHIQDNFKVLNSASVRDKAKYFFETMAFEHAGIKGGNDSNFPVKCTIHGDTFVIPQNSRFLCGDVIECCKRLNGNKYDIVIADPPWWNKYIRRLKTANSKSSYSMMYNEDIASIPVTNLFADNCLVAVWCTNSPSNIAAVKDLIFPKWKVDYLATWFWLKVNTDFKPLCEFAYGSKKQPYERIILGKVGNIISIPNKHLVTSVPSALHSHKIPLLEILQQYVDIDQPKTLELFARYMLPNTTSVGYEPLKWQHISLYEVLDEEKPSELCKVIS
ncbi:N(6)-adenine-specific methyltransferase METTL4 [Battus philenor]|uniref:N(6)-adenine-specific methyltransferase METTL4 n=1 Tax=Battus philenor TaxID=42288 RepID=UPI0035CEB3C2